MLHNDSNSSSIQRYADLFFWSCTAWLYAGHCTLIHDRWLKHIFHRSHVLARPAPPADVCWEDDQDSEAATHTRSQTHTHSKLSIRQRPRPSHYPLFPYKLHPCCLCGLMTVLWIPHVSLTERINNIHHTTTPPPVHVQIFLNKKTKDFTCDFTWNNDI